MEEYLKSIGITGDFVTSDDGCITLDLKGSEDFMRVYSKLDKEESIYEDEDSTQITYEASSIQFVNDDYTITLLGDLENNTYKLVMREN